MNQSLHNQAQANKKREHQAIWNGGEQTELPTRIEKLGMAVNNALPSVNCGGCGMFAAMAGRALKDKGIPVRIRILGWNGLDLRKLHPDDREDGRAWNRVGLFFTHVIVEFKHRGRWWAFDSERLEKSNGESFRGYWMHKGSLTLEEMEAIAKQDFWNPEFPRKKGERKLAELIPQYL